MDKDQKVKRFDWLPIEMPGVAKLVRDRRKRDGDAHVNECWKRGVMNGEPGWFFAREGPLALGTPDPSWTSWPELEKVEGATMRPLLMMRDREVPHGAA